MCDLSSLTRDWTHNPCIGRQILNYWTYREVLRYVLFFQDLLYVVSVCVLVAQSCPTHWDPVDCSPPGSSSHGILQARILEQIAIPFSRGSSWPRDRTQGSWIKDGFLTIWVTREAQGVSTQHINKRVAGIFCICWPLWCLEPSFPLLMLMNPQPYNWTMTY